MTIARTGWSKLSITGSNRTEPGPDRRARRPRHAATHLGRPARDVRRACGQSSVESHARITSRAIRSVPAPWRRAWSRSSDGSGQWRRARRRGRSARLRSSRVRPRGGTAARASDPARRLDWRRRRSRPAAVRRGKIEGVAVPVQHHRMRRERRQRRVIALRRQADGRVADLLDRARIDPGIARTSRRLRKRPR